MLFNETSEWNLNHELRRSNIECKRETGDTYAYVCIGDTCAHTQMSANLRETWIEDAAAKLKPESRLLKANQATRIHVHAMLIAYCRSSATRIRVVLAHVYSPKTKGIMLYTKHHYYLQDMQTPSTHVNAHTNTYKHTNNPGTQNIGISTSFTSKPFPGAAVNFREEFVFMTGSA